MQFKKQLDVSEQYHLDEFRRICPTHSMRWAKIPWKNEPTFDDAIAKIAASNVLKDDVFIGITHDDWLDLLSKKYLCIEDGFYLATGVDARSALFRFEFRDEVFFNMRPDFSFLSLATDLNEPPINEVESVVRNWLIDCYRETEAIKRAIAVNEIDPLKLYPIETWIDFWGLRGIAIENHSLVTPNKEKPFSEPERQKMLTLIIGMAIDAYGYNPESNRNSATGDKNGISAKIKTRGISVSDDTIRDYLKEAKNLL